MSNPTQTMLERGKLARLAAKALRSAAPETRTRALSLLAEKLRASAKRPDAPKRRASTPASAD